MLALNSLTTCTSVARVLVTVSVLQCVAACCSVLQRVADASAKFSDDMYVSRTCPSDRVCVAACCSVLQRVAEFARVLVTVCVLQCVAACCSVSQCVADTGAKFSDDMYFICMCPSDYVCVAVCCSVLQCIAVYCSVLQCIAVYCSALQCSSAWQCVAV